MSKKQKIALTVDAIIFNYSTEGGLSILLVKRKNKPFKNTWALPGGFVDNDETLKKAIKREVKEEVGLKIKGPDFLSVFDTPERDPRGRVVSAAFCFYLNDPLQTLNAGSDAKDAMWFGIEELPDLAFDHSTLIEASLNHLKNKCLNSTVIFKLLKDKFTFSEFQLLLEYITKTNFDRRNFKKKVLQMGILDQLNETDSSSAGRPATLYSFNQSVYTELVAQGSEIRF